MKNILSVVGAVFLELWKRYSSSITYHWDLSGFDQAEVGTANFILYLAIDNSFALFIVI